MRGTLTRGPSARAHVAFYDPYLEILGGGEKYLLSIVEEVASSGRHRVELLSPRRPDPERWRRLNINVDPQSVRWRQTGQLLATPRSLGAELFITLTNYFPPASLARHSAAIIQFPFSDLHAGVPLMRPVRRWERGLRLRSYDTVVCYSQFVAGAIRERLGIERPLVIAPPVDLPDQPPATEKKDWVLAVGRFFSARHSNNKKHDVLIDAWRELERLPPARDWTLHLAGGVADDSGSQAYLEELQRRAAGLSIRFHPNASENELHELYVGSSIFWHAAGHGETRPERLEHFGITTVEAMAYGCVPVVLGRGGQREIVEDRQDGILWQTVEELISITAGLMGDPAGRQRLGRAAAAAAKRFSRGAFLDAVHEKILTPAGIER